MGKKINLFILTWNMGNKAQSGLKNALTAEVIAENDLICIGLQESTYKQEKGEVTELADQIATILGQSFYQVQHVKRVQLQMFLFAKTSMKERIGNIEKSIENTGFLGVFPNKGGLLCTFQVDGTKLAFVSCHLTAHEGVLYCAQRNASITEILGGVRAGDYRFDIAEQFHHVFWMGDMNYRTTYSQNEPDFEVADTLNQQHSVMIQQQQTVKLTNIAEGNSDVDLDASLYDRQLETLSIETSEIVVDIGDDDAPNLTALEEAEILSLNSQRRAEFTKTFEMIQAKNWPGLLQYDELNREMASKRVLNGFTALQPSFPPTFKRTRELIIDELQLGVKNDYNIEEHYNHARLPSFTDRILYKSMAAFSDNLHNTFFHSCEATTSSDHKAVMAGFTINVTAGAAGINCLNPTEDHQRRIKIMKHNRKLLRKASCLNISMSNLKGHALKEMDAKIFGVGGKSDPYICISSDPPDLLCSERGGDKYKASMAAVSIQNKPVLHSLDPVWKDALSIRLASIDLQGLTDNASLIMSVWDYDRTNHDDLIGVCTFPLRDIIAAKRENKSYDFKKSILAQSLITGEISGTITVQGEITAIEQKYEEQMALQMMEPLDKVVQQRRKGKPRNMCPIM